MELLLEDLGGISAASLGVILRAIVTLEQEGADIFFGEPEFDVDELLRTALDGRGIVTLLEVADVMDRPRLYSTFVLWLLAQLYERLPEVGDIPKPKLAFFFDEARYVPDPGNTIKIIGQKRPTLYTGDGETIDTGLENVLLERTLYYAFQFVAAGGSEYAQWRQSEAALSRQESEMALSRAPQQFRMKPQSKIIPGR